MILPLVADIADKDTLRKMACVNTRFNELAKPRNPVNIVMVFDGSRAEVCTFMYGAVFTRCVRYRGTGIA